MLGRNAGAFAEENFSLKREQDDFEEIYWLLLEMKGLKLATE